MDTATAMLLSELAEQGRKVGLFADVASVLDTQYPRRPDTFSDGIRTVAYNDIPADALAEQEGAEVRVRLPLPHHKKASQGWLYAWWSY
jgi:hypothetical protein